MLRTQISLPEELRRRVDKQLRAKGKSLGEYAREAIEKHVQEDEKEKEDLKMLAQEVIGSLKITDAQAEGWIKEIREDRKLSDDRLEQRWEEALKSKKKK